MLDVSNSSLVDCGSSLGNYSAFSRPIEIKHDGCVPLGGVSSNQPDCYFVRDLNPLVVKPEPPFTCSASMPGLFAFASKPIHVALRKTQWVVIFPMAFDGDFIAKPEIRKAMVGRLQNARRENGLVSFLVFTRADWLSIWLDEILQHKGETTKLTILGSRECSVA